MIGANVVEQALPQSVVVYVTRVGRYSPSHMAGKTCVEAEAVEQVTHTELGRGSP